MPLCLDRHFYVNGMSKRGSDFTFKVCFIVVNGIRTKYNMVDKLKVAMLLYDFIVEPGFAYISNRNTLTKVLVFVLT